ncbi:hypothetical protein HYX00_00860 [Candidatus Woesearchaeota archaeon]|nr:hypothetical protein [Candidatus Woesearchaeota archaeon]
MEEDFTYKDISELKKELEGLKGKKDISTKELYEAVQKLSQTMTDMLEIFGAAAEQMKLEEREYEAEAKKHEMILSKLDKIIDQNKTIAEAMVGVVDMIKEKLVAPAKEKEESFFKPVQESRQFMRPPKQEWQPRPEPVQRTQPIMAPPQMMSPPLQPPSMSQPAPPPDFGMQMPPMEPTPSPDLDFPDFNLEEEEPKKKGLFGMFKK